MILKRQSNTLQLEEQCQPQTVSAYIYSAGVERTTPGGHWFALCQVPIDELKRYKAVLHEKTQVQLVGQPTIFAIDSDNKTFEFSPATDIEREVRIRYNPIIKEV